MNDTDAQTSEDLHTKSIQKFNNMNLASRWKKSEDPSAKVISALVTQVNNLEQKLARTNNNQANVTNNSNSPSKEIPKLMIDEWRIKHEGPSCVCNGKTWYWRPHHKKAGLFNGLYMIHKPEDHEKWCAKKYPNKKPRNETPSTTNSTANSNL